MAFFSASNNEQGLFQTALKALWKKYLYLTRNVSQPVSETSEDDAQVIPCLFISSIDFIRVSADASVQQIFKTILEVKQLLNAFLGPVQNEVLVCLMADSDPQCHFAMLATTLACGKQKKSYLLCQVQKWRKIWSFLGLVT